MSSETVQMTEEQSAYQIVATYLKGLEDAYNIGVENGSGGSAYYPHHQEEIWKWEEVLRVLEPASRGAIPIWLTREQADILLDISRRVIKGVEMWYGPGQRDGRTEREYALHAAIAAQLRAQGEGE